MSTTDRLISFCEDLLAAYPTTPIAWPGKPLKPPSSGLWLLVRHFPNETEDLSWGNDGPILVRGFFQVEVNYRHGSDGIFPASELADTIIKEFGKGVPISDVFVEKTPWQSPEVVEDDRNFIPVTVPYYGTACPE